MQSIAQSAVTATLTNLAAHHGRIDGFLRVFNENASQIQFAPNSNLDSSKQSI